MRNYFPNQGAEDATRANWNPSNFFGSAQPAESAESSTENPHTGNRSTRVEWPESDGSGKSRMATAPFQNEGIHGKWRVGAWIYIPSGSPDVQFGSLWEGSSTFVTVTEKDTWVNVETVLGNPSHVDDYTWLRIQATTSILSGGVVYIDDIYAHPGETGVDPNEPEITVEVSWTGGLFDKSPAWDDISEYVQAFNPKHGRPNEIGSAEAGTCSLVLDNADGRFTPNRSASPYYPNIKPRRPVRIWATWDGAEWPLFRGHVDRWPIETVTDSTNVTVALVDIFGVLAKKPLENPYLAQIREYAPREAYPMNDGPESFAPAINTTGQTAHVFQPAGSVAAENELGSSPSVSANAESIFPNEAGLGCLRVDGVGIAEGQPSDTSLTGRGVRFPYFELDTSSTSSGWSVSFFHSFEGLPPNDHGSCLALRMQDRSGRMFLQVLFNANPFFKGYTLYWPDAVYNDGGGFGLHYDEFADSFTNYKGGNHVIISFSNDCRGDGSNVPGIGLTVNGWGTYREIPGSTFLGVTAEVESLVGSLDTARINEGLGATTIQAHNFRFGMFSIHDMPIGGWDLVTLRQRAAGNPAQTPDDRIWYLLGGQLGWPAQLTNLDRTETGTELRYLNWEGTPKALDELRKPSLDSNGLLFVSPAGFVTYQSRRLRQNPKPHLIFDHDAGTGIETPLNFDMSEQDIINVVDVDNAYGVKTQVRNEESVEYYDEVSQGKSVRLESDAEAVQFGYYIVNRFGEAQLRIDSVVVNPSAHSEGALWGHVLSGALSTVIGLRNLPGNAPDADQDYFIEAVQHEVERSGERLYWRTTYQVSPAVNREAWILGDSTYGVLGSTTRLHY